MMTRHLRTAAIFGVVGLFCSSALAQDDGTDESASENTDQGSDALDDVFAGDSNSETGDEGMSEVEGEGAAAPADNVSAAPQYSSPAPASDSAASDVSTEEVSGEGVDGFFDDVRLSVGTGPMPINSLTAGVAGLGTRLYKPHDKGLLFAGLSHVGGNIAEYDEGERDERWVNGVRGTALSGGYRLEKGVGSEAKAIPYGLVGGMLMMSSTKDGSPDDGYYKTNVNLLGAMGGVGIDAALTPVLSLGAEFGGVAMIGFGSRTNRDGDVTGKNSESVLSTYAAVQATVRR